MSHFIDDYIYHTKDYESPTSFWKWSAYSAISAVLRDNCYRRQGDSRLFPSIYVMLLAVSGHHRKGRPVELCEQLVAKVGTTKIISGRTSIQAILDELSHTETDKTTGKIAKAGSAIFFAPELAAGIVSDPAAIGILTDIYDFKMNPWVSRLRTQAKFRIDKLVFGMFSATNEDMSKDVYNSTAINGGLLARTFLVVPSEFRPSNDLLIPSNEVESYHEARDIKFNELVDRLIKISLLKGEFLFNDSAITEYRTWYKPFRDSCKDKQDRSGITGRIQTGIIKLAMILAANELSLEVRKEHVELAITECLALLPNYSIFSMSSGMSNIKDAGAAVLTALLASPEHKQTRKQLLSQHWNTFDSEMLDRVIVTFTQGGLVIELVMGSEVQYQLTPKCIEVMGQGAGI